VSALKREPLFRALRCDKPILAALEATVDIYSHNSSGLPNRNEPHDSASNYEIPLLAMLHTSNDELQARALKIIAALDGLPLTAEIGRGRVQIGGGALPRSTCAIHGARNNSRKTQAAGISRTAAFAYAADCRVH
jgi:L-seryl-tRNA(Ser) seleniumtransferase